MTSFDVANGDKDCNTTREFLPASGAAAAETAEAREIKRLQGLLKQCAECLLLVNEGKNPSRSEVKDWIAKATPERVQEECEAVRQTFAMLADAAVRYQELINGISDLDFELAKSTGSLRETRYTRY